jgi:hypothetical protein
MSIQTEHPDYQDRLPDWQIMRDTVGGARRVKKKLFTYLPATSGMVADGAKKAQEPGWSAYQAYLSRAVFPNAVDDAVKVLVGAMHRKPAKIEVPDAMKEMLDVATRERDTMENLLRKINEEQLLTGRIGLLVDVMPGRDVPHFVPYVAESITNWDEVSPDAFAVNELQMLVLKEIIIERVAIFEWMTVTRYRACLVSPDYANGEPVTDPMYQTFTEDFGQSDQNVVTTDPIIPKFKGNPLKQIPFVCIGSNDLTMTPDEIPLLGLADYALVVYRGEADFRSTLFMLGQDTLVTIGEDPGEDGDEKATSTRIGVGAKISLPLQGDAKFIGVSSEGLPEQRRALVDDHTKLREMGSRLLEPRSGQAESGEALKVRVAAQTSTLLQLAITAAAGLEKALKIAAEWMGLNPDDVTVTPNLDFAETKAKTTELRDLMDARERGAPLSFKSIHAWAKQNGFTDEEFDTEIADIKSEKELQAILMPAPAPIAAVPSQKPGAPAPAPGTKPGAAPAPGTKPGAPPEKPAPPAE